MVRKKYFRNRLHSIIFIVLVSLSSSVLMLGLGISFYFQEKQLIEQATLLTEQIVSRSSDAVSAMFGTIEDTTYTVVKQLNLGAMTKAQIHQLLSNSTELNRDIQSIMIFNSQGEIIDYSPQHYHVREDATLLNQKWYDAQYQFDQSLYSVPHPQQLFKKQTPWVISNTVPFYHQKERYLLMIDFRYDILNRLFNRGTIGQKGYTFIVNANNELVYHPQQQMEQFDTLIEPVEGLENIDRQVQVDVPTQTILVTKRIAPNQWRVVGKASIEEMVSESRHSIIEVTILSFVVLFILIAYLSFLSANYIAYPIQQLAYRMQRVGNNILTSNVKVQANYAEAESLNSSYNQLIGEVQQLMAQAKAEEAALRKAERNVLEAQIQPHFLYNTLESILWMMEQGQTKSASKMVRALGTLFRNSLNGGKEYITLNKEFEQVKSYLEIQSIRYNSQFEYQLILPEALQSLRVIKLIIQPLVENAIYHGISRMVDPGNIVVRAYVRGDVLMIEVSDNGLGIEPQQLRRLRIHLNEAQASLGIGLRNVHERIQLYYGDGYGLQIESELDKGTVVRLSLPYEEHQVNDTTV